ncbi:MAG TPA: spore coat protein [Firmicutes bacterium]|nr:spore coat protein [Bacillota bacterium]
MANLTTKELSAIDDQLSLEETMIKKYKMFSQSCTDPQLKTKCEQIAAKHQEHYTRLLNQLN